MVENQIIVASVSRGPGVRATVKKNGVSTLVSRYRDRGALVHPPKGEGFRR